MKTRRNKHFFSGGVGEPEAQPIQEAVPLDVNDPKVDADIKADAVVDGLTITSLTGNENIDDEVAKLTEEEGYYFRAMINAIGICNSTMKMKHNLLNPLNPELIVCGEQCHKRADIIRKTFERFIPYLQRSDALGYISSQRVLANSGTYLKNSLGSLGKKGFDSAASLGKTGYDSAVYAYQDPRAAVGNASASVGKALYNTPTAIGNAGYKGLTNVGKSLTAASNYFTRKAPQATQTPSNVQNAVGTSMAGTVGSSGLFGFGGKRTRRR